MSDGLIRHSRRAPVDLVPVSAGNFKKWLKGRGAKLRRWIKSADFNAQPGTTCLVPNAGGSLKSVLAGVDEVDDPFALAHLPAALPPGIYRLDADWPEDVLERAAIGWALGVYQFTRYRKREAIKPKLLVPSAARLRRVREQVAGLYLVRDLVNTPAEDMSPQHLSLAVKDMAGEFHADVGEIVGDGLLSRNYPAIHAVGRAATHQPRLVDLRWG
jgi:leucyl aminopeptidase